MSSKYWLDHGFPFVLSLQLIFGFLKMLDYFGVVYYPTIDGATRKLEFSLGIDLVVPMLVLLAVWCFYFYLKRRKYFLLIATPLAFGLVNLELATSFVTILMFCVGLYSLKDRTLFSQFLLGLLTLVNGLAVAHWGLFVPLGLASPFEWSAMLTLDIFYVFSVFAPLLVLPVLFIGILKPLMKLGFGSEYIGGIQVMEKEMTLEAWALLVFSLLVGIFAAVYPWLPTVNPEPMDIGVDIQYYLKWINDVRMDWSKLFDVSWGSRPLMILAIMGLQRLTGYSITNTIRVMPVILLPLLILGVFFVTWQLFKNSEVAAWASFLTASGIQVTVGMYSYFLSNILALSMISVSLGLFIKSQKELSYPHLFFASFFGGLVLFTHPWTFDQYFSPLLFVALILYYKQRKTGSINDNVKMLVLFVASLGLLEILRIFLFRGMGGLGATQVLINSISRYEGFWDRSIFFFRFYYGGFMAYVLLLLLVLIGLFFIPDNSAHSLYFKYLVGLTGIVYLFVSGPLKSRLIYNLPLSILASLGFSVILKRCNYNHFYKSFLFSTSLNYLFICISNI